MNNFNSSLFGNLAGQQAQPGLILRSDQTQTPPPNPRVTNADFIVVAGEVADEQDSNNRRTQQSFNQPRFGSSRNNRNAENVYVARMEMRSSEQRTRVTPTEALEQRVDRLQGQVELMQGQLASLLGSKAGINRELQRPSVFGDPNGNREIDVA